MTKADRTWVQYTKTSLKFVLGVVGGRFFAPALADEGTAYVSESPMVCPATWPLRRERQAWTPLIPHRRTGSVCESPPRSLIPRHIHLAELGHAMVTVTPECSDAFTHGVIGTDALYVFTFSKVQDPPSPASL